MIIFTSHSPLLYSYASPIWMLLCIFHNPLSLIILAWMYMDLRLFIGSWTVYQCLQPLEKYTLPQQPLGVSRSSSSGRASYAPTPPTSLVEYWKSPFVQDLGPVTTEVVHSWLEEPWHVKRQKFQALLLLLCISCSFYHFFCSAPWAFRWGGNM